MKAFVRVQAWLESEDGSQIVLDWRGREFEMSMENDYVPYSFGPMVEYIPLAGQTLKFSARKDPWKFRRGKPEGWT